jgi:maltooligosyltrehalose trehalohydrolase
MGEECLTRRPFQFFTDHIDHAIAHATREGRKQEFEHFASFSGDVPDPQSLETFLRSKLGPCEPDPLYRELLELRRELPRELEIVDVGAGRLHLRRGGTDLVADFAAQQVEIRR